MGIFRRRGRTPSFDAVAGNGLINRRALLGQGVALAGAAGISGTTGAAAEPLKDEAWSLAFGEVTPALQTPSRFEKEVTRALEQSEGRVPQLACAHAASPAQRHHHAERAALLDQPLRHAGHRSGQAQAGDPRHGEAAARVHARDAVALSAGDARRTSSNAPATRRRCSPASRCRRRPACCTGWCRTRSGPACRCRCCSTRRASIRRRSGWSPRAPTPSSSTAASRSRRPTTTRMVAIYQNGERLMPGNGYPMRLLLPGYQGNMNVKFLRRLKAVDQPAYCATSRPRTIRRSCRAARRGASTS